LNFCFSIGSPETITAIQQAVDQLESAPVISKGKEIKDGMLLLNLILHFKDTFDSHL
jgi:hypothetical protein